MKKYKKIILLMSIAIISVLTISQVAKKDLSPADKNTEKGTKFVMPKAENTVIQDMGPLRAVRFEIQVLSDKSDVGKANDILLTIMGSGFNITDAPSEVIFSKDLVITNIETNAKGTELYVIISKETLKQLINNSGYKNARIMGGNKPASKDSGKISITSKNFADLDKTNIVSLKYRKGFFAREK